MSAAAQTERVARQQKLDAIAAGVTKKNSVLNDPGQPLAFSL
jgi:hypothetical protein